MSTAMLSVDRSRAGDWPFTRTENWYRHGLVRDVLFTDGAKYVADQAGAYWLLDEIAVAQRGDKSVRLRRTKPTSKRTASMPRLRTAI